MTISHEYNSHFHCKDQQYLLLAARAYQALPLTSLLLVYQVWNPAMLIIVHVLTAVSSVTLQSLLCTGACAYTAAQLALVILILALGPLPQTTAKAPLSCHTPSSSPAPHL